jgi:hypothetical protein
VQRCGWAGLRNGDLLSVASDSFDVLVTGDRNLEYQQNALTLPIAVVVVIARNNRIDTLLPPVPAITAALTNLVPRTLVRVGGEQP